MARAGLVRLSDASFEKDGKTIPFRKVGLTREGQSFTENAPVDFVMKETGKLEKRKRKTKSLASRAKSSGAVDTRIEKALLAWRLEEAHRSGIPAIRILTDKVLRQTAISHPATSDELIAISGIGMSTVENTAIRSTES